ncbi:MAG: nucleoside-triphosphatase [Candidatus Bathyarchaeia archaeon]
MLKRVILLTGNPGVGKTTVLTKAVNILGETAYAWAG